MLPQSNLLSVTLLTLPTTLNTFIPSTHASIYGFIHSKCVVAKRCRESNSSSDGRVIRRLVRIPVRTIVFLGETLTQELMGTFQG